MSNFLYVDNSNVWIEGMRVSAVESGMAPNMATAEQEQLTDTSWKVDFGRLHDFAGGSDIGRAVLYGSRPPANDTLWAIARSKGFEVVVHDRNFSNREKKVDTSIATDMVSDSFTMMTAGSDEVTLVAGDSDYVPTIENLRGRGFVVHVVFWDHASGELKQAATNFISLNAYLEHLRR